jgi:Tfp pilus assembly protein PilE
MSTNSIILIVLVVIVAILLIATIAWVARDKRNQHRHVEADKIREAAKDETLQVKQREALADETAAQARAAQAEADVKATQSLRAPTAPKLSALAGGTSRRALPRPRAHHRRTRGAVRGHPLDDLPGCHASGRANDREVDTERNAMTDLVGRVC